MARTNEFRGKSKKTVYSEFDSLDDMADYASGYVDERFPNGGMRTTLGSGFYGKHCPTPGSAFTMARTGWDTHLADTLEIARHAVETVEADTDILTFTPVWDVTGSMVDIGEYLSGVPECMIEVPPAPTTRHGRIVTMCASISYSSAIHEKTLVSRGKVIAALAMELSRIGIGLELYADFTSSSWSGITHRARILVKGPNDTLDPSKILFAFANPGMLRVLGLTSMHGLPEDFKDELGVHPMGGYGSPTAPVQDLPEGTIYLPEVHSNTNIPDAAGELRRYLTELGLVNESA